MSAKVTASGPTIGITHRDRLIFEAVGSAGALDGETIRRAVSASSRLHYLNKRLPDLVKNGYLSATLVRSIGAPRWLYSLGPKAVAPGTRPWKPSLNQLDHTLTICRVLSLMLRQGFAEPCWVTGWQGEAEIRSNTPSGQPYPDLRVFWDDGDCRGSWAVEVDRSTESHPVWRRKMARYLYGPEQILAITISARRAKGLIGVGRDVGVDLLATTEERLSQGLDPWVLSTRFQPRVCISEATLGDRSKHSHRESSAAEATPVEQAVGPTVWPPPSPQ